MSGINYKIRPRGKWDWRKFDTVRMEISVGQEYHEGEKLRDAFKWAHDQFKHRYIILGDTTQRFNKMFEKGISETSAHAEALRDGDLWLERNAASLGDAKVTRWDDWRSHPEYQRTYDRVLELYKNDSRFHEAIQTAISGRWERRYPDGNLEKKKYFFEISEKYLLEETAVLSVAYDKLGGISAYPGDFLKIWEMFIDAEGSGIPPGLKKAHCTRLYFNKRSP